jgi:hypothetical protein
MVRDHTGITLSTFNGLWSRGDTDNVPADHFSDCANIDFVGNAFKSRDGIGISQTVNVPISNIKRIYNYPTQNANTLIVLAIDTSGNGNIYHVVSPSQVFGPILTIAGMTDFAFVAYAGRGFISPFALSPQVLASPGLLIATLAAGTGLSAGIYQYATTFINANGETAPSPLTTITTTAQIAAPAVTPLITQIALIGSGNALTAGATYKWLFTYALLNGLETTVGGASAGIVAPASFIRLGIEASAALPVLPTGANVNIYRTIANGATYFLETSAPASTFPVTGSGIYIDVGSINDTILATKANPPVANNTTQEKVQLNSIPIDPLGNATARNIYRTAVGASQLKLDHVIANNTTTSYLDANADGTLGVNAPTLNTAFVGTTVFPKGMNGQFVYIYAGDGTAARKAAGAGLTGVMTVAAGVGGTTDIGQHIFGIVSQTISGYDSPPSIFTPFVTTGTSVSFGSIPTSGSAVVVKRLLVSTITIPAAQYALDSNPLNYEYFFVPGAVINNNSDTFLNNVSFFDADLLADASHLLNNYTAIPAGAVLNLYHNRLVVAATFTDISLALVSQPGEPEAISQISGLIVAPLDGNSLSNAQEYRDILYMFKRSRTLAYSDNGGDPSSWPLVIVDNALGTSVHGISTVLDSGSASIDFLIIATYQGISVFNGKYITPELSWKISNFWKKLDRTQFYSIQIVNEPVSKRIFCVLPNRQLLVGNYVNGMDWKNVRWIPWTFLNFTHNPGFSSVAIQNISDVIFGADLI